MRRATLSFLAGFVSTLVFHQTVLLLFKVVHLTTRSPWAMKPVPPFGVPSVISLAFWGGVWGIVLIAAIARARDSSYWLTAALFGGIFPTLVAGLVIQPLKGQPIGGGHPGSALLLGLAINAVWGLGTAILYRLFSGRQR